MSSVKIIASIHVSPDCDIDMRVDKLDTDAKNKKYAVLSIGSATIFINNHDQALEIASLLVQAAQEMEEEDESN